MMTMSKAHTLVDAITEAKAQEGEDRGNDARITSNYPPPAPARDYLFMMNPVSRKMESSSGCNVICNVLCNVEYVYLTYSMQKV